MQPVTSYFIYTNNLIFTDGTTLRDFLDINHRLPYGQEYNFKDIDYQKTKWYAFDINDIQWADQRLPDGTVLDPIVETLTNLQVIRISNAILGGYRDDKINSLKQTYNVTDADFDKVKQVLQDRYVGEIKIDGNPMSSGGTPFDVKIGTYVTDDKGEVVLKDLISSYYGETSTSPNLIDANLTIKEVDAPEGYELVKTEKQVNIRETNEVVFVNNRIAEEEPEIKAPDTGSSAGETNAIVIPTATVGVFLGAILIIYMSTRKKRIQFTINN